MMYKVMIVEDEHYLLQELCETVEWERYACELGGRAENGEKAEKIAAGLKPDLIITDIRLPGMDGLELLRRLNPPASLVITGFDQFQYARDALRIGVVDFLLKPIDDEELDAALRKALIVLSGQKTTEKESLDGSTPVDTKQRHVAGAKRFIERHYPEDVSLSQAAEYLCLSEAYLARIFRDCTGKTFVEALTEYRLNIAKNLLMDQRLRIEEIAGICGFRHPGYFARIFKKQTGESPSLFRSKLYSFSE